MSDFINKREFVVYSPLVKSMPMKVLHHACDTRSLSLVMFDPSGSSKLDSFKLGDISETYIGYFKRTDKGIIPPKWPSFDDFFIF